MNECRLCLAEPVLRHDLGKVCLSRMYTGARLSVDRTHAAFTSEEDLVCWWLAMAILHPFGRFWEDWSLSPATDRHKDLAELQMEEDGRPGRLLEWECFQKRPYWKD
jgi:hypothetical protein